MPAQFEIFFLLFTSYVGHAIKSPDPVLVPEHPWEESLFFYHSVVTVKDEIWLYYSTWTKYGAYVCLVMRAMTTHTTPTAPTLLVFEY